MWSYGMLLKLQIWRFVNMQTAWTVVTLEKKQYWGVEWNKALKNFMAPFYG